MELTELERLRVQGAKFRRQDVLGHSYLQIQLPGGGWKGYGRYKPEHQKFLGARGRGRSASLPPIDKAIEAGARRGIAKALIREAEKVATELASSTYELGKRIPELKAPPGPTFTDRLESTVDEIRKMRALVQRHRGERDNGRFELLLLGCLAKRMGRDPTPIVSEYLRTYL